MKKKDFIFSDQEIRLLDSIIKDLNTAIKNSVLYTTEHSICEFSIKNLKKTLDKWLVINDSLSLGISQDELFCNDIPLKAAQQLYKDVAGYLHLRGILSLTIRRGVTIEELTGFFSVIRLDSREIRASGGISQKLPGTQRLRIKEVDYSDLLFSAREKTSTEEVKVWQKLFDIADELRGGNIPETKMRFLKDFLKNTEQSSRTLNRLYHDAVKKLDTEQVVTEMKETVARVCAHFEKGSFIQAQEAKVDIMRIMSNLNPDLVSQLFEKTQIEGEEFDMAEKVTRGFSDSFIADFIESLISHEESVNENLLKVFDKLAPNENKADSIVSMVADKMLSKRILNPETLSQLQMSIKDIFSSHPDSNFMSQMYKITVEAVTNKKIDTLVYVARLSPLIGKFVQSIDENKLKKEEVWLLLNLLWLEKSAAEFRKFGMKLLDVMPELLDGKDISLIHEIMEFFTDNLRPEQVENEEMNKSIKEVVGQISSTENLQNIISLIPEARSGELEEIASILARTDTGADSRSAGLLVDAFIAERNPVYRNKYKTVLTRMKKAVVAEVLERMDYGDPMVIRDLFPILREYSPSKAHIAALRLISHNSPQVRWEGLNGFVPESEEERASLFNMFKKEKIPEIQKKVAEVLLSTKDAETLRKLFLLSKNYLFHYKKLLMIVELCGQIRLQEAFPFLRKLFRGKALIFKNRNDKLRMAVVTSLGRLHTQDSMDLINEGASDKREKVRKMSEILLKLDGRQ